MARLLLTAALCTCSDYANDLNDLPFSCIKAPDGTSPFAPLSKHIYPKTLSKYNFGGREDHLVLGGYGKVIDGIVEHINQQYPGKLTILTNSAVTKIDYTDPNLVNVAVGDTIYSFKTGVISTLPIGVMQDVVKTQPDFFVLNLPNDKKQAILRARQGITNKVIIKFKEAIMDANLASFFPAQNEQAVICPTQWINFAYYDPNNTLNNSTTIMGLCYGERGNFSGKNDADILNAAIQELSTFLHIPIQELQQNISSYHITHWEDDPYARGAWDTNTIQEHTKDRLVILAPIDNKIYFAGDHVSAYGATTHGAFISGQDAATTLVQSLWKKYITKLEI